jgi:RND family efflux transporter MFP subunit
MRSAPPRFDLAGRTPGEVDAAWRRFGAATVPEEFCQSWLELQCQILSGVSDALVVLQKPGVETFAPVAFWPEARRDRPQLSQVIERALREGRGLVEPRRGSYHMAYPVRVDDKVRGVVGLEIGWREEAELQAAMRELQWGAAWLELLLRRAADPLEAARLRLKTVLELVAVFLEQPQFRDAATALVTELASRLGCDRVVLGLLERGAVHIEAVSHAAQFDRHANLLGATLNAMSEALDQREAVVYPAEGEMHPVVTLSHAELAQASRAGSIATFPLSHEGRQIGALTLERAHGLRFERMSLELVEGLAVLLGPLVEMRRAQGRGLPAHAAHSAREFWTRFAGAGHIGLKLAAGLLAALAIFLSLATGTWRVAADARVEGEIQRAITAPFQGYVRESPVRAGDTVSRGQLLARLDDRDLQVERARLVAQREQYGQQYRDAMSRQERAQVRIASAQMAQAEAQLTLVEEQLARTEIVAPFDGVLVSGDLTQSLGAPLERGQVMLELAPLDAYRVVLQVDEHDFAAVKLGQKGELILTSLPGEHYPFVVSKITPVAAAKEGRNLFRVEAKLDGAAPPRLRPGMEGVAKIDVEERRLAWIWSRRLLDWLRLKSWAWLP